MKVSQQGRKGESGLVGISSVDQQVIDLLAVHRVMTTTQLIAVTGRAERTVCYRMSRLHEQRLVTRTRPTETRARPRCTGG